VVKSASDFEIIVNPPVPEGPGPVLVSLRLLKVTFPAPDVVFTYLDWVFAPGSMCFNDCGGDGAGDLPGGAPAGVRGNCYSGSVWDPLNEQSRAGPVCNCSSVGFQGFGCGQETALAYITPRSGPLEGGTLVTLFFMHLGPLLGRIDSTRDIKCRFGAQVVAASHEEGALVKCQSPPFQRNGSVPLEFSLDGGRVWSRQGGNQFHYYTPATLEYAIPSAAPLTGGTIITVYAAYNHTFVSLPRLAEPCFADPLRSSGGEGATFDMSELRYGSAETGPCPREVAAKQQDRAACIFRHESANKEVHSDARIVAMDALECRVPDLVGMLRGEGEEGEGQDISSTILELQVTLDGQRRLTQEVDVGVFRPLSFLAFIPPVLTHISPDTGPLTETTDVTVHGYHLSPPMLATRQAPPSSVWPDPAGGWGWGGGRAAEYGLDESGVPLPEGGYEGRVRAHAQQVRCFFDAGAGPDKDVKLRQGLARRMAAVVKIIDENTIVCRSPKIWRTLAEASARASSRFLRNVWVYNISISLNAGHDVYSLNTSDAKQFKCADTPLQWGLSVRISDTAMYRSTTTCGHFRYVPMWEMEQFAPVFGPESGRSITTVTGANFVGEAHPRAACRFWNDERSALQVEQANQELLADQAPVGAMLTCSTPTVQVPRPDTLVRDHELEECLLQRPYDPACPRSDTPCNGVLVPAGTSRNDYVSGYRRGLCLPPSFSCTWQYLDDTTTWLTCALPEASSYVDVRSPDLPVARSQVFFITMNGEHWSRAPALYQECTLSPNGAGSRSFHKCEARERITHYEFTERPNITTVYPDVADYTKSTVVTVVGEGFQPSSRATLRIGEEPVCGPSRNETCLTTAVTFVDSLTLIAVIPPHPSHWVLPRLGHGPTNFSVPVTIEVALNGQVMLRGL
jgi:hypothetical protein